MSGNSLGEAKYALSLIPICCMISNACKQLTKEHISAWHSIKLSQTSNLTTMHENEYTLNKCVCTICCHKYLTSENNNYDVNTKVTILKIEKVIEKVH